MIKGLKKSCTLRKKRAPILLSSRQKSPSCGVSSRYDGSFTKTLVKEPGITARLLKAHGLQLGAQRTHRLFVCVLLQNDDHNFHNSSVFFVQAGR